VGVSWEGQQILAGRAYPADLFFIVAGGICNGPRDTMMIVRLVEAQYEDGVLRPIEGLRSGERVSLMVVRRPDPHRWDLARFSSTSNQEELSPSEQGLGAWASWLDATERS
jgi:predicted DNA-binding antitoxin AbrB/MazE fold protein